MDTRGSGRLITQQFFFYGDHLQGFAEVGDLDELDLSLINTLQIDPRAPWTRIGQALDLDPVTAARRWSRLTETGAAWITAQPVWRHHSRTCLAYVELDCEAGQALQVANTLAEIPHVLTVEHTSGDRDLLCTVAVPDLPTLSRLQLESMGILAGVRAIRSQLVTELHSQAGEWRLRALDAEQRARLERGKRESSGTRREISIDDRRLIMLLGADGRASLTDLAAALDLSVSTVRRRLTGLLASGDLVLRCEVAQSLSGWPVSTWIWAHVPPDDRTTVPSLLNALPEIRACLGLTGGSANLCFNVWLRSLHDARRLEALLARTVPNLTVLDRAVVLRFVKRMGRILDPAGRSVRAVPLDIWSDPAQRVD